MPIFRLIDGMLQRYVAGHIAMVLSHGSFKMLDVVNVDDRVFKRGIDFFCFFLLHTGKKNKYLLVKVPDNQTKNNKADKDSTRQKAQYEHA